MSRRPCADTIRVIGITSSGRQVGCSNSLVIRTPKAGAPTVADAIATSPTTATILLTPPRTQVSVYLVSICSKAAPTNCIQQNSTSIQLSFVGLAAGAEFSVSATALIGGKLVPASNSLPLTMPAQGAPTLLAADATGSGSGEATAAAPSGTAFDRVRQGVCIAICNVVAAQQPFKQHAPHAGNHISRPQPCSPLPALHWHQYVFTVRPLSGAAQTTVSATNPRLVQLTGLQPSTQ